MFRHSVLTMAALMPLLSACGARSSLLEFEETRDGGATDSAARRDAVTRRDSSRADSSALPDRAPPPALCDVERSLELEFSEPVHAPSLAAAQTGEIIAISFSLGGTVVSMTVDSSNLEPLVEPFPVGPGDGGTLSGRPFGEPGFTLAFQDGTWKLGLAFLDELGTPFEVQETGMNTERRRPPFAVTEEAIGFVIDPTRSGFTLLSGQFEMDPTFQVREGSLPHLAPSGRAPGALALAYATRDNDVVYETIGPFGETLFEQRYEVGRSDEVRVVRTARSPEPLVAVGGATQLQIHYGDSSVTTSVSAPVHDLAATYLESMNKPLVFSSTGPVRGGGTFTLRATTAEGQVFDIAMERADVPVDIAATYSPEAGRAVVIWTTNSEGTHTLRGATVTCR